MKVSASQVRDGVLQELVNAGEFESVTLLVGDMTDTYPIGKSTVDVEIAFGADIETWREIRLFPRIYVRVPSCTINGVKYGATKIDCRQQTNGGWYVAARPTRYFGGEKATDAAYKEYTALGRAIVQDYRELAIRLAEAYALVDRFNELAANYRRFTKERDSFLEIVEKVYANPR